MISSGSPASGRTQQPPADLKTADLLNRDLALLTSASRYDVDEPRDQLESNRDLVNLFFTCCRALGPDLFVEAGAMDARASRRARKALPDAQVVAFEANPYNYRRYRQVNEDAGVEYVHRAVADRAGDITFNVLRDESGEPIVNGRSSILRRTKQGDDDRGFEEHTVSATSLDDYLDGRSFDRAALWIDVEGASGKVLTGAPELLARTAVVMIEVEELNGWGPEHWRRDQVASHLYDAGLIPIARDFQYKHQYNLVFVRAELLAAPSALRWILTRYASRSGVGGNSTTGGGLDQQLRRRLSRSRLLRRALRKPPLAR